MMGALSSIASSLGISGAALPLAEIIAFAKADFSGEKSRIKLPLVMDDTKIELTYAIAWESPGTGSTAQGESAPAKNFKGYTPDQKITLKVMVDATGVHKPKETVEGIEYGTPDISKYIEKLRKTVYCYDEEGHSPPYLHLVWGKILGSEFTGKGTQGIYKCVLDKLEIDYQVFAASGNPVRAEITISLKPYTSPLLRPKGNSPDLSHVIEIKHGDNLAKLCKDVYDDTRYYHDIVRINNLPSAYAIKPGMQLLFPPLDPVYR
jgi:Contractile injection system tube protein